MSDVRIGVIGIGNIGTLHTDYILNNEIKNAVLTCVCDIDEGRLNDFRKNNENIQRYENYEEMIKSKKIDAVIIATPHYLHPEMAINAFEHGLHVISEKPVGVFTKKVIEMNKAATTSGKVFSSMFCVRTDPYFRKIKSLVDSGELGEIKRINWIATDWYRPQAYHNSSNWRSTWKGEGGGVLVNQSPHNLDMLQWIFGLPESVTAFAEFGKYFDIEVEDEVTAYMKYKGFSCVYIASTGEAPGTNRLEIAGTMGKLILENGQIEFLKNIESEREFNKKNTISFARPECRACKIPPKSGEMKHQHITQNFVDAIIKGDKLIAPGENGINEVMLSNAIHMSAWTHETVTLPIDSNRFYGLLCEKIRNGV